MSIQAFENDDRFDFDKDDYNDHIHSCIHFSNHKFQKILKSFTFFNIFFLLLIVCEIVYFFAHLAFLVQSFVMAVHLALIFTTVFCYFTFHMYTQTRKIEKFIQLKDDFIHACKNAVRESSSEFSQHLLIAQACCKFAEKLHAVEYSIYSCPSWAIFLHSTFEKINCWWFWQDVHFMKELLLQTCVKEHIHWVRAEPTDLESHTGLANAYVMLSGLYVDPRTVEGLDDDRWIPPTKFNESFKYQFRSIAQKAIEEFKIISDYAPLDPWVHAQLAYSYHDLQMPKEEIKEYETILQLSPEDKETLYKLGKLYFEQGENAKGLQVYENLRKSNFSKAESLIHFYGTYRT